MALGLNIELDPRNPKQLFAQAFQDGMPEAFKKQMSKALSVTEREVKKSVKRKFRGGAELAGSYTRKLVLKRGGTHVDAGVLSKLVYAKVQDLGTGYLPGGAIRPKPPGKALAIPLLRDLKEAGIWPRHNSRVMDLIVPLSRRTGKRQALLVDAVSGVPMYILVPETRFRGKFYIKAAIKAADPQVQKIFGDTYRVALTSGGGAK